MADIPTVKLDLETEDFKSWVLIRFYGKFHGCVADYFFLDHRSYVVEVQNIKNLTLRINLFNMAKLHQ